MSKKRKLAYLAMIGNVLIWGAALPIVKPSLSHISPFQFLFLRYLIAVPILLPFAIHIINKNKVKLKTIAKISLLEILAVPIPLSFLYFGLSKTTSIEASLLTATTPIFITLGGILFLKEKEEKKEWIGLAIAFIGTILLTISPQLLNNSSTSTISTSGNLLVILHNVTWASYLIIAKKVYKNIPKTLITSVSSTVAMLSFLIITMIISSPINLQSLKIPSVATAVLYMGILGTPIAFTLYLFGQNLIEASEASLFNYLTGPIAIPFGIMLLQESVSILQISAILVIITGVILGEYRSTKSRKKIAS